MRNHRISLTLLLIGGILAGCAGVPSAGLTLKHTGLSAKANDAYYQLAEGKTGTALLTALHNIIAGQKDLGYNGARNVMFGTIDDPQNNDTIECVYTGRTASGITDSETASNQKINTEHSWPQSLGAVGAAKADLHHLFPADTDTNGARGNLPFGEVASKAQVFPQFVIEEGQSRMGMDAQGHTVFEPRSAHKGDLARALMYFYTRYALDSACKVDLKNYRIEEPLLKKWSQMDPVDAAERARNEAIYKVQGNRNPFVDHPEYAEAI